MKNNQELQRGCQNADKWEPKLDEAKIWVRAENELVSYTSEKNVTLKKTIASNNAVLYSDEVESIENFSAKSPQLKSKSDSEVAQEVFAALKANDSIPKDKITVKVEKGWVTLEGDLPYNFQREATKSAIKNLQGVKCITINIKIKSDSNVKMDRKQVEKAFAQSWSVNDSSIIVDVLGTTLTLTGRVGTSYQKEEAGRIAWNTPGIKHLINALTVDYYYNLPSEKF